MQSCKITTSWLDLLLASVEVEKYKNWFNPKHCNQALCTEGKWEKIRHNLCWFDFLQCFRSLLTSSKPCAVAGLWFIATAWISEKYSCVANLHEDGWFWLEKYTKCTQIHKYTKCIQIHKYTNTQIHKFAQIHKCAQRRMVLVGKVHKVYKVRVQQPSELWPRGSPPHLHTGSTHPTFSERGSLMRREIVLESRLFLSSTWWLFQQWSDASQSGV